MNRLDRHFSKSCTSSQLWRIVKRGAMSLKSNNTLFPSICIKGHPPQSRATAALSFGYAVESCNKLKINETPQISDHHFGVISTDQISGSGLLVVLFFSKVPLKSMFFSTPECFESCLRHPVE